MELDGVGEEEGGDVAGVGAGDRDDAGLGQLLEDPHRLRRRRLPERMRRRRQRAVGVHRRVPAKAAAAMAYEMLRRHADDLPTETPVSWRGFASESDHMKGNAGEGNPDRIFAGIGSGMSTIGKQGFLLVGWFVCLFVASLRGKLLTFAILCSRRHPYKKCNIFLGTKRTRSSHQIW